MTVLLEGLNDEQQAAVTHGNGPLMIIAGAGTGKTTAITRRIAWLIEQGLAKPDSILALTFTDKAAGEMEERVDQLLPMGYVDLWVSTFHAFCERLLRLHGAEIGLPIDFTLSTDVDTWLLLRKNLTKLELNYFSPRGNPTRFLKLLAHHFSRAKDEGATPEMYQAHVEEMIQNVAGGSAEAFDKLPEEERLELAKYRELGRAYGVYQQILLDAGALDFGDLLSYAVELLTRRPNILKKYQDQFTYIIVDEFQDTNSIQYKLVKLLASKNRNLTVVGDDDQAIYKFRGAALMNILTFRTDFPDATKILLTRNYRSGSVILDAAHKLISGNNPHRLEVTENLSKKLLSHTAHEGFLRHQHAATLEEEVEGVTKEILRLHQTEGASWNDCAILVRGNDHADPFLESLERAGVPYKFMALEGLYTKPLILDCLAYMRVVDLPSHSPAFYRILSHPRLGLNEKDLGELMTFVRRKGGSITQATRHMTEAIGLSLEGRGRILEIQDTLSALQTLAKRMPVTELFVEVVKRTGILGDLTGLSETDQQEAFSHLNAFLSRLKRYVLNSDDHSLHGFLDEFDAEREAGEGGGIVQDPGEGPDVVNIMTVHGAKGLEFRFVFVVNLVEQRFPSQSRGEPLPLPTGLVPTIPELDDHLAEERRLMYVAMTRAKEGLYFCSADDYGGARKKKISRFVAEIGCVPTATSITRSSFSQSLKLENPTLRANSQQPTANGKQSTLSFSQLAAFDTCPLQYKYAHILKVPSFGRASLSFGKSMHNTLQHFMERLLITQEAQSSLFGESAHVTPQLPSLAELLDMFNVAWIDEWYASDEERERYREDGRTALKVFYAKAVDQPPTPLALEKGFTLKIGEVFVKGRIDRIDTCEGGVEIIDYKTGNPKTGKLDWQARRQLVLYALAAEQCFDPPLVVKKLTYYYLDNNTAVSFEPTDKDKAKLVEEILDTTQRIRSSSFTATPGDHCRYCDFKDICPFMQT